jgi:predicted CoA-substrate-specific enzyme activase
VSVPYADKCVTEITCHGTGACHIHGKKDLAVIDIGGQDTKLIVMQNGMVTDFVMNDKCSAGTGRFLEIMANTLSVRPEELCELASRGGNASISSMCTVFAESEVISLIGRGECRENIAYAVVDSISKKVASQASRLQLGGLPVCLTGGLCAFPYLRRSLSALLGTPVLACEDGRYAGAVGAALRAAAIGEQFFGKERTGA